MAQEINNEIEKIKERNRRVEADKAWETSYIRRILVAFLTYLLVVLFLHIIDDRSPWLNALVPTAGFILSTLTLSLFKNIWIKYLYKR